MAYTAGNLLCLTGMAPGRNLYRYDTTDLVDEVEDAGYFNNVDDNLRLAIGDRIDAFTWSDTPHAAGNTISAGKTFVVTNVIADDAAAAAGNVNIAEVFIASGIFSSDG
jgi:hypothetical protein